MEERRNQKGGKKKEEMKDVLLPLRKTQVGLLLWGYVSSPHRTHYQDDWKPVSK